MKKTDTRYDTTHLQPEDEEIVLGEKILQDEASGENSTPFLLASLGVIAVGVAGYLTFKQR